MGFPGEYKCTRCNKSEKRELLSAKKVSFQELGVRPRIIRSRIVAWLCPPCVARDEDWRQDAYATPGMAAPQKPGRPNLARNTARYQAIEEEENGLQIGEGSAR